MGKIAQIQAPRVSEIYLLARGCNWPVERNESYLFRGKPGKTERCTVSATAKAIALPSLFLVKKR